MSPAAPSIARATAVALASGALLLTGFFILGWSGLDAAWAGLDFNAALFEDFLGPYWKTASALAAGDHEPAELYVYPAFGAWLLAPLTLLGDAAASWSCAALMIGAAALLLASLFTLRPPSSTWGAAAVGAAALLAHPVVHGAYWGQAALPVAALTLAAVAAWSRGHAIAGGALLGIAAAIKLTPLIFLAAPLLGREQPDLRRALGWGVGSFLFCAVLIPLVSMGPSGFLEFHLEAARHLRALAGEASTSAGGRGSQDPGALLARSIGDGAFWVGKAMGLAVSALLVHGLRAELRGPAPRWDLVFVLLAALPWLLVTPTWTHGLIWIVVAWRAGWSGGLAGRALVLASLIMGSLPLLRWTDDPVRHAELGIPAAAAALALAAALLARGRPEAAPHRRPS